MSGDAVSLGDARSRRSGDCRDWSPLEALRDLVRAIEAGEVQPEILYVAMATACDAEQLRSYPWRCAGGDKLQLRGLLVRHLQDI